MRSLLKVGSRKSKSLKEKYSAVASRLQNAAIISVLLGFTWVFGFMAIEGATFTFQLIFCICNSLQGVLILFLFCLRDEDVRKALRSCCVSTPFNKPRSDTYTYTGDKWSLRVTSSENSTSITNPSIELSETETGPSYKTDP